MAFTYTDTLLTDRDCVRFSIGDVTSGSGPKPADANFSDAEIAGLVTLEGTWQRATAGAFEALASLWAKHVNFAADGTQASQSDIAKQYRESAALWRGRYGTAAVGSCGSSAVTRVDGYSDDLDNMTLEDSI